MYVQSENKVDKFYCLKLFVFYKLVIVIWSESDVVYGVPSLIANTSKLL